MIKVYEIHIDPSNGMMMVTHEGKAVTAEEEEIVLKAYVESNKPIRIGVDVNNKS